MGEVSPDEAETSITKAQVALHTLPDMYCMLVLSGKPLVLPYWQCLSSSAHGFPIQFHNFCEGVVLTPLWPGNCGALLWPPKLLQMHPPQVALFCTHFLVWLISSSCLFRRIEGNVKLHCLLSRITYKTAYRQAVKMDYRKRYQCCPGYYESSEKCVRK